MGGRRDGALVTAGVAGRIRVIGVDVSGFVLDAFFSIRAVSIRAFVPVVRAVLAPVTVAVLVRGRRDGALVAAYIAGRIRVIGVVVRGLVLDALAPIQAVIVGAFVPVARAVLAPVAVVVLMVPPVYSDCRLSLISRVVSRDHGIFRSRVIVAAVGCGKRIERADCLLHTVDGHGLDAGGRLSRCSRIAHGEGVRAGLSIESILDGVSFAVRQSFHNRGFRVPLKHMIAHSAELLLIAPVAGAVLSVLLGHFRGGVSCAAFLAGPDVAVVPDRPAKFMATCAFLAAQLQLANYSAVIVGIWQAQPLQVHAPIFVGDKKLRCGAPVLLIRFLVAAPLPPCRAQPHGLPVRGSDFDVLFYSHRKFLILHHCHVVQQVRASSDRGCRQLCIIGARIKRKGQRSQRCVLDQNVPAVAVHAATDACAIVALRPHHAASDGNVIARTVSSATDSCAGIVTPGFDRSTGNLDMMRIFRLVLSVLIAAADSCSA